MEKRELIRRICELDPIAKPGTLANFSAEDLAYHLQLVSARRAARSRGAPRAFDADTTDPASQHTASRRTAVSV